MLLVIASGVVLQVGLFSQVRVAGAAANVLLLLTVAGGIVAGDRRGAVTGFCCGLAMDLLLLSRPFGLSALAWSLVGYLVGRFQLTVVRAAAWVPMLVAATATVGAVALYVLLARILAGLDLLGSSALTAAMVMAAANAVLVLPARGVMRWAWDENDRLRTMRR